jgi:transposase
MLLTTIPGISYYSVLLIAAEIADIKRFSSPKKLASYAGLVPLVRQSGSKCFYTRTSKECCTDLKWILIQAAHIHVRCCNSPITRLFRRILKKKGYNKAIVAAARKMITIIWHMLNKKEVFKIN